MLRLRATLAVAFSAAVIVTVLLAMGAIQPLELPARDAMLRSLPSRPARTTCVLAIDEASLRAIGRWPWPRTTLAQLVNRAADAGAKAVVIDVLLPEGADGDAELAKAMRRVPAILVSVLQEDGDWLLPAATLRDAATAAHGNFELDHDGIVRRLAATKQNAFRSATSLSLQAAAMVSNTAVPIGRAISPGFRTPAREIPLISAADVLRGTSAPAGAPALQGHNGEAARMRGKIVFLGATAAAIGDRVLTPTATHHLPDAGVTVQAAATESILRGETIEALSPIAAGAFAALLIVPIVRSRSRRSRLTVAALATAVVIGGGALLLDRAQLAIPFVTLTMTIILTTAAVESVALSGAVRDVAARFAEHRQREAESKQLLAHELKTPLASMRGLTQLLGGFQLTDAERQRVVSLLDSEAGKLQSMVTALLDLERLPLRDFAASTSVTDLSELAQRRVDFLRNSTDRTIAVDAAPGVVARADAPLIERVIDNLVGNALKYTPASAAVTLRVYESRGDAVLEVEDRGPGITAAERQRIFDRFFRGATAAGTTGLGLGLAFVAEIARWHQGSVTADVAPHGGSIFRVTMPAAHTAACAGAM
jgi:signal transduction histidine kinase